jgi:transposase
MGLKHSRLSQEQQDRLMECFVLGVTARTAAEMLHLNKNTTTFFYHRLRLIIQHQLDQAAPVERDIHIPERHLQRRFGHANAVAAAPLSRRAGRSHIPLFGLSVHGDRIYVQMLHVVNSEEYGKTLKINEMPQSIVCTSEMVHRDVIEISTLKNYRLTQPHRPLQHVDKMPREVTAFWSRTKRQLRKYHGIPRRHLSLFLYECEFRFNYGRQAQLLRVLQEWIKYTNI